jgi:hypothetical protein
VVVWTWVVLVVGEEGDVEWMDLEVIGLLDQAAVLIDLMELHTSFQRTSVVLSLAKVWFFLFIAV